MVFSCCVFVSLALFISYKLSDSKYSISGQFQFIYFPQMYKLFHEIDFEKKEFHLSYIPPCVKKKDCVCYFSLSTDTVML